MHIFVKKSVIIDKLTQLAKVAGKENGVIPIVSNMLFSLNEKFEILRITAGDTDIYVRTYIRGDDFEGKKAGKLLIPAKKLYELVNKMGESIEIKKLSDTQVLIRSGKSEHKLSIEDAELYPLLPDKPKDSVTIKGIDLKEVIKKTRFAVSTSENTPVLQGIKFLVRGPQMTAEACDRHRLAQVRAKVESDNTGLVAVVKGTAFKDFLPNIPDEDVEIKFEEKYFFIETDDYMFCSRVFDAAYPDTSKLVPASFVTEIEVNKDEFQAAVERALIIALDDKTNVVNIHSDTFDNELIIKADSAKNNALEAVDATIKGDPLKMSANGKYIIDALKALSGERITIYSNGGMQPFIFRGSIASELQLILPYRTR